MRNKEEKQEHVTAEEEDPPPWKAGIEEAKLIMKACLKAAEEVCSDHYAEAGMARPRIEDQNVANIGIAMYQSVVMMEMERGRLAGLKMQMLAQGVEMSAAQLLKVRG